MAVQRDVLIKLSLLMLKTFLSQGKRRRRLMPHHRKWKQEKFLRLHKIRRLQHRLTQERMLYLKMLTSWVQANSFRRTNLYSSPFWWEKTVKEKFTDSQWLKYFRMSKKTFTELANKLSKNVQDLNTSLSVAVDKKIAITVLSLGSGKKHSTIASQFAVDRSEVANIIKDVCEIIVKTLMPQYIKVPDSELLKKYIDSFSVKWGFPQCAGVLGSIHVPIRTTRLPENAPDYINSNGEYSMFLQGVADPCYRFWDINIGWPGSVSESKVFTSSALWVKGQEGTLFPNWNKLICETEVPVLILAGSSYPLAEWVMKPFQRTDVFPKDEQKFNERFSFVYNASEIAFKRLKARWNCMVTGNICTIDFFPNVAAACCVLHNICEYEKEPVLDEWIVNAENFYQQPLPSVCNSVIGSQAEKIQSALKNYFQV